jgi:hypothetical protein
MEEKRREDLFNRDSTDERTTPKVVASWFLEVQNARTVFSALKV